MLASLHWLPVVYRIQYKLDIITFKALTTEQPTYLGDLLHCRVAIRHTRSSAPDSLVVPSNRKKRASSAVSHAAPIIWNNLPHDVRQTTTVNSFRIRLPWIYWQIDSHIIYDYISMSIKNPLDHLGNSYNLLKFSGTYWNRFESLTLLKSLEISWYPPDRSRRARARSKNHCFHRCGKVCSSCSSAPIRGPSAVDESLITMGDNSKNWGSYLYDLFRTNAGGRRSATETMQKIIQIVFRQKLVTCFYSERKAVKTQMGLTYKEINYTDNTVQNCNKSVHTQENSVTESQQY